MTTPLQHTSLGELNPFGYLSVTSSSLGELQTSGGGLQDGLLARSKSDVIIDQDEIDVILIAVTIIEKQRRH